MQKAKQESEEGLKIMSGLNPPLRLQKRNGKGGKKGWHERDVPWKRLGIILEDYFTLISVRATGKKATAS